MAQLGNFLANAIDHRAVIKIALLVRNHASHGPRKLHELADFSKAVRHERGNRDATDFLQRQVQNNKLGNVRQLQNEPIQRLEADFQKVQRQVVRHAIEFAVGDGTIAIEQSDSSFIFVKSDSVFLRQRLVDPIALVAIALCEFRRKWYYAFQHELPSVSLCFKKQSHSLQRQVL